MCYILAVLIAIRHKGDDSRIEAALFSSSCTLAVPTPGGRRVIGRWLFHLSTSTETKRQCLSRCQSRTDVKVKHKNISCDRRKLVFHRQGCTKGAQRQTKGHTGAPQKAQPRGQSGHAQSPTCLRSARHVSDLPYPTLLPYSATMSTPNIGPLQKLYRDLRPQLKKPCLTQQT